MEAKQYELRFLPLFEADLNEVIDYISITLKNPAAAMNLIDEIQAAVMKRLPCAEAFERYPSMNEHQYPYYRIFVKNYIVFYVAIDGVMEVRRLVYNRRNLQEQV